MVRVLVVGDIIIDEYICGTVKKICPEAPVPVVSLLHTQFFLGGAANVANNISALGHDVHLCGLIGQDKYGKLAQEMLDKEGICYELNSTLLTTIKKRVYAKDRIMIRIDEDNFLEERCDYNYPPDVDIIIVSDYGKGTINEYTINRLWEHSAKYNIPIIVDPCLKNINLYKPAKYLKLNGSEWASLASKETPKFENIIVTLEEEGCVLHELGEPVGKLIPVTKKVPVDVAGAGDTFCAALAIQICQGWSLERSCQTANEVASEVVTRVGICVPSEKI